MHKTMLIIGALASPILVAAPAVAAPTDDATSFINSTIEKFNSGDTKAFIAAHELNALIIDDFGQHMWSGPNSAKHWLDDFARESAALGNTGGHMDYGKPIAANSDGNIAYVVMPTTYHFVEKGTKMAGTGSMTFVVKHESSGWKVASWTYSGATPMPEK